MKEGMNERRIPVETHARQDVSHRRWGFALLIFIGLVAVAFIVLIFYQVEDARGVWAWKTTRQSLQDTGQPVDFRDLIPPEIPADQNLAAIPLFQTSTDPASGEAAQPVALRQALAPLFPPSTDFPRTGNWLLGQAADLKALDIYLTDRYQKAFQRPPLGLDLMGKIDALCPALNDLRQAAAARPQCRFQRDYTSQPPYLRPLAATPALIKLAQVLNLHALAALQAHRPDLALDDITLTFRLDEAVRHEPVLVSGLVASGIASIQLGSVWQGLTSRAWSDSQLAQLQSQLQNIDFLSDYQLCLRGEALGFLAPVFDYLRDHRSASGMVWGTSGDEDSHVIKFISWLTPRGAFDGAKARGVDLYFQAAREPIDLTRKRIYPDASDRLARETQAIPRYDIPDLLLHVSSGPVLRSVENFAEAQFRVDAATIACALERYHLAHAAYPASLDALGPYAPGGLPHDLINDESYHYRLRPDGTYLLYSVGWDQTDDGGRIAHPPGHPTALDQNTGDWVWPSPP
jgi:hypothetical protein